MERILPGQRCTPPPHVATGNLRRLAKEEEEKEKEEKAKRKRRQKLEREGL